MDVIPLNLKGWLVICNLPKNEKVAVTHLTIAIAILNNDQLLTKEKVSGQSVPSKCYKSINQLWQNKSTCYTLIN